jgi:hypothetical protein
VRGERAMRRRTFIGSVAAALFSGPSCCEGRSTDPSDPAIVGLEAVYFDVDVKWLSRKQYEQVLTKGLSRLSSEGLSVKKFPKKDQLPRPILWLSCQQVKLHDRTARSFYAVKLEMWDICERTSSSGKVTVRAVTWSLEKLLLGSPERAIGSFEELTAIFVADWAMANPKLIRRIENYIDLRF